METNHTIANTTYRIKLLAITTSTFLIFSITFFLIIYFVQDPENKFKQYSPEGELVYSYYIFSEDDIHANYECYPADDPDCNVHRGALVEKTVHQDHTTENGENKGKGGKGDIEKSTRTPNGTNGIYSTNLVSTSTTEMAFDRSILIEPLKRLIPYLLILFLFLILCRVLPRFFPPALQPFVNC